MATTAALRAVVDEFLELSDFMTAFQMKAFLVCVQAEGSTQKYIEEQLGTSNAVASRLLARWMEWEKPGKKRGYGLIQSDINPEDRRYRMITLTPKGRKFADRLKRLTGETDGDAAR